MILTVFGWWGGGLLPCCSLLLAAAAAAKSSPHPTSRTEALLYITNAQADIQDTACRKSDGVPLICFLNHAARR